jgi:hypothetical protein
MQVSPASIDYATRLSNFANGAELQRHRSVARSVTEPDGHRQLLSTRRV